MGERAPRARASARCGTPHDHRVWEGGAGARSGPTHLPTPHAAATKPTKTFPSIFTPKWSQKKKSGGAKRTFLRARATLQRGEHGC